MLEKAYVNVYALEFGTAAVFAIGTMPCSQLRSRKLNK